MSEELPSFEDSQERGRAVERQGMVEAAIAKHVAGIPETLAAYDKAEGLPASVFFKPERYRDVWWCPYLSEPVIMEWTGPKGTREPFCPGCGYRRAAPDRDASSFEAGSHTFICHIGKPMA